jgi:hypothetical protein
LFLAHPGRRDQRSFEDGATHSTRRSLSGDARRRPYTLTCVLALALCIANHASGQQKRLASGAPPYCASSSTNTALLEPEEHDAATPIQFVSDESLLEALLNGHADLRLAAAEGLPRYLEGFSQDKRKAPQTRLSAALSDPNIHVREKVALALRRLGSPEEKGALARSLKDPEITDTFFSNATGRRRPFPPGKISASTFSPNTIAAVTAFAPDFLETLATRDEGAIRQLIASIEGSHNADTTPVLAWLLAHGDTRAYGPLLVKHLMVAPGGARLVIGQLLDLLATSRPDNRLAVVQFFARMLHEHGMRAFPSDQERINAALIDRLKDPNIDVSTEAARALGLARATQAVGALVVMLDRRRGHQEPGGASRACTLRTVGTNVRGS